MKLSILVPQITPRLQYVLHWLFQERLGLTYQLYTALPPEQDNSILISYGTDSGILNLPDAGLLSQTGIQSQDLPIGVWNTLPVLFYLPGEKKILPFDLFSAIFFLLSRYEEYLPFPPDKHQRYPAEESILYRMGILERPIVDEWVLAFGKLLQLYGAPVRETSFRFLPTYDVDMAWHYRHKGLARTLGGYIKDTAANRFSAVQQRTRVLLGHQQDPYDSFTFIDGLAERHKPLFFILAAKDNSPFDRHTLPGRIPMRNLITRLSQKYELGIHPSYYSSEKAALLQEELQLMESLTGKDIRRSRQHYIRFRLPDTFRKLVQAGIQQDYSMGYGRHLGFRAGTSNDFYWYDLHKEEQTSLRIFPFCFMDTTAHFEAAMTVQAAFEVLNAMKQNIRATGGLLVTIFHNFSLGTVEEWMGWREQYERFNNEME